MKSLGGLRELTGHQHFPIISGGNQRIELRPRVGAEAFGKLRHRLHFNQRFGDHPQLNMFAGNIKMMDAVAEIIAILIDQRTRIDGELEGETALGAFRARVHAHLHQAFADGGIVAKLGQMADGIEHICLGSQRGFDRIGDVGLIQRSVGLRALAEHGFKIGVQAADHDFVDLSERESRLHASSDSFDARRSSAGYFGADLFHRRLQRIGGKADGVREAGIQHQKFGNAIRAQVRRVGFAVRLKCGAGSQQADPFERLGLGLRCRKIR